MSRSLQRFLEARAHRSLVAIVTALAFAFLVSVSASHIHITADEDAGCAVCVAFAGKVEGPTAELSVCEPARVAFPSCSLMEAPLLASVALVVLPPSCGPPHYFS